MQNVKFITAVPGNHEENTDKLAFGHDFLSRLEGTLVEYNRNNPDNAKLLDFPEFVLLKNGDLARAPFSHITLNNYEIITAHKYAEHGSGKGSSERPSSHITSWLRNMGEIAKPFDIALGAHYHIIDIVQQDGKLAAILGGFAGESGYEIRRQYGAAGGPAASILHFRSDGGIGIEILAENGLKQLPITHPEISRIGVDRFITNAFTQYAGVLGREVPAIQKIYRREIQPKPPIII
jgi:hypothetical protein